jgi:hypothetical protein
MTIFRRKYNHPTLYRLTNKTLNNYSKQCCVRRKPWTWPNTRNRMQTTNFKIPTAVCFLRSFFSCVSQYGTFNMQIITFRLSRDRRRYPSSLLVTLRRSPYQELLPASGGPRAHVDKVATAWIRLSLQRAHINIVQKITRFERKILRKIYELSKLMDGTWRIKANEELDNLITKLRGLSPQAKYTDQATAPCQRS